MMGQRYDFAKFKTDIDLVRYAGTLGFEINKSKSTPASKSMRNGHDKIVVSRKGGKWIYWSPMNESDNGTIIQFLLNRTSKTIGQIGKDLNSFLGGGAELPSPKHYEGTIKEKIYNPLRISNIFEACQSLTYHAYLETRGIDRSILSHPRFKGRVFKDRYNNVVFPHFKDNRICGLELKNIDKGIFVRGGEKTLWRSNIFASDDTLILSEAAIDALSYHALFKPTNAIYGNTGGGMSEDQADLIARFVESFKGLKTVLIITDNDKGGDALTKRIITAIQKSDFKGHIKRHSPERHGADWNDILNEHKEVSL